ncbi:hypothetical protein KUV95_12370 [Microbulbifer agarilyticus]|uniref:hypothetical protein n=1 Tax=Microbulbifer agarilyticus TaxID=260552 RepID=UPI001C954927|nr:hypothetical protein [Microbulbifer agarilyticus]MBY6212347.1 hypothetical protein [Microbulbifer agarilyticus]
MKFNRFAKAFIAASSVSLCSGAMASDWKYSLGADVSSGDYGSTAETDITSLPFTVSYSPSAAWTFKASLPWVSVEGPGDVIPGGDGGFVIGPGNGFGNGNGGNQNPDESVRSKESGLGDLWLTGTYSLEPVGNRYFVDLSAKYKVPLGDEERGLGTGESDYTLQMEVFTAVDDFTPFVTVARKFKGDLPDVVLRDVWYTSVGSGYRLSEVSSMGASLDYQQAATDTSSAQTEIFGYYSHKLNNRWTGMLYGYIGLADGSPDQGFGLQISYRPEN